MFEFDYRELKSIIIREYDTLSKFGEKIGWDISAVSLVLHNRRFLRQTEIDTWCEALHIEAEDIGRIFFTRKVHETTTN